MRRTLLSSALACTLLMSALAAGATPVAAQDEPPPGALDGVPVGAEPDAPVASEEPAPEDPDAAPAGEPAPSALAPAGATTSSTPPNRYFSRGAYEDIEAAVAATPRSPSCSVSDRGLKGLVLSPIFFESSGALTASSAPSPMTLSRYDEWNPNYPSTTSNLGANRSLYAQRDPYTAYPRAYWHPGIGIWQYDSAGIGAPYTAVERMDARVIAPNVASRILLRYCNAKASGQSDLNARKAAWADWVGCAANGCEQVFQELVQANFSQMQLLTTIDRLGGTALRTCSLPGRGSFSCAYVDHRQAQGARWWAQHSSSVPINDGNPTSPPAPLSAPFYVFELDGREHRHWLSTDTGYSVSLSASRTLGRNARYRTDQSGSGLTWQTSSSLCDVTAGRGSCATVAPAGVTAATFQVSATYRPVALDADGDGRGDILWYRPGSASDPLWLATGAADFTSRTFNVNRSYDDVLTGDIDGLHGDDVLWYSRSTGSAHLWRSSGDGTFSSITLQIGPGRRPFLLDSNSDGAKEIFWYGPGSVPDALWTWNGSSFSALPYTINAGYEPIVGDFDGNGHQDILWYAPLPQTSHVWYHTQAGGMVSKPLQLSGTFTWRVGDFDGDSRDDILWYAPGTAHDAVWFGVSGGTFSGMFLSINLAYQPVVADVDGTGRDDIVWYAPGSATDHLWRWSASRQISSETTNLPGSYLPVVGPFSSGSGDGILWYAPGTATDILWYR